MEVEWKYHRFFDWNKVLQGRETRHNECWYFLAWWWVRNCVW